MKRTALVGILMIVLATTGFAFTWIAIPGTDSDMMIRGSAGMGHLIFIDMTVVPIGVVAEVDIPGFKGVSAGGGIGFTVFAAPGAVANVISTAAYAKCTILDFPEAQAMTGLPFAVGTAVGIAQDFTLGGTSVSSGLGVVFFGFNLWSFTFTSYVGWVDKDVGGFGEVVWNITPDMHLSLFYVPLVGLGISLTVDLELW